MRQSGARRPAGSTTTVVGGGAPPLAVQAVVVTPAGTGQRRSDSDDARVAQLEGKVRGLQDALCRAQSELAQAKRAQGNITRQS